MEVLTRLFSSIPSKSLDNNNKKLRKYLQDYFQVSPPNLLTTTTTKKEKQGNVWFMKEMDAMGMPYAWHVFKL